MLAPSVVLVGHDVYEGVGSEGGDHQDVGHGVAPLGQTAGGEQEVGLVVQGEDHSRKSTYHVTQNIPLYPLKYSNNLRSP